MQKRKKRSNRALVSTSTDPLLFSRLRNAGGGFTVKANDRYVRVIMDVEVTAAHLESAASAAVKHYANGCSDEVGEIRPVSLALRPLCIGDRTLGVDPEIKYFFGTFAKALGVKND